MKQYTLEDLRKMTPEARSVLYQNSMKRRSSGGQQIIDLLEASGLEFRWGSLRGDDPVCITIREIIWSDEGKKAVIAATAKNFPALAGVEPRIVAELGGQYTARDGGTVWAGFLQAELMRHLGYVEDGPGKMPDGSVAKTAMKWKARPR